MTRTLVILVMLLAAPAAAATFWLSFTVFADNSCLTTAGSYNEAGEPCRFPGGEVWCDPASATCEAESASQPALPICGVDKPEREALRPKEN